MNAAYGNNEDRPVDEASLANMNFEPWDIEVSGGHITLRKHALRHMRHANVAIALLCMTRDQMVSFARANPDLFFNVYDAITDSAEAFGEFQKMLEVANSRMLVAGAVVVQGS